MPNLLPHELEEKEELAEKEALRRYSEGQKPSFSKGVCENLTCGYGRLDDYGYWEFPLYPAGEYMAKLSLAPVSEGDQIFLSRTRELVGQANLTIAHAKECARGIQNMNIRQEALDLIEKFWEKKL